MNFFSTRDSECKVTLSQALAAGLAPDGGLFVPASMPLFEPGDFAGADTPADVGAVLLRPFFQDDPLSTELKAICDESLDFPISLINTADPELSILELFHGPTAAFKDVGARFLAACLKRIERDNHDQLVIMVATSGDTGGAVAAAFDGAENIGVSVLFPEGMVSPRQQQQLTCWSDNIASFCVQGTFDDCQRLVKQSFLDTELNKTIRLTSANSISVGRLLPQMIYYAWSSLQHWRNTGQKANYIIPTGNLGNALACIWARHCGLPIGEVVLATNANQTITRYLDSGQWLVEDTIATLASAMDVGNPSNMERLKHLLPDWQAMAGQVSAYSVSDEQIKEAILQAHEDMGEELCPHTATAYRIYRVLKGQSEVKDLHWTIVATAHPAKFETIVEPLLAKSVDVPRSLNDLLSRPSRMQTVAPDLQALRNSLLHQFSSG